MQLEYLDIRGCKFITDLRPIAGMPLEYLNAWRCNVSDLTPLKGMPLNLLEVSGEFNSVQALQGAPLTELLLESKALTSLKGLQGLPLQKLEFARTNAKDMEPLRGMLLKDLTISATASSDLTQLDGLQLTRLVLHPEKLAEGTDAVRSMKSLVKIGKWQQYYAPIEYPPDEFWRRYDAGEFNLPPK